MFQTKSHLPSKQNSLLKAARLLNLQGCKGMFFIYFFLLLFTSFANLQAAPLILGDYPVNIASADFNGNGFDDLAVINLGNGSGSKLTLYVNDGQGNFTQSQQFSISQGNLLSMSVFGDFTGNGLPDLAVSSPSTDELYIFLNDGQGKFAQQPVVALLDQPTRIAVGKFRSGGLSDIAVLNTRNSVIDIYFSNGDGTFTLNNEATFPSSIPTTIATGDVNGDGLDDLVVGFSLSNEIQIFLNDQNGSFTAPPTTYSVQGFPSSIAVGDLNNDGFVDIAVANLTSNSVSVLMNQGGASPGTFNNAVNYATQNAPIALALVDLTGNGFLDIVATNEASSTTSAFINNGNGTFQSAFNQNAGNTPISIASGRFTRGVKTHVSVGLASNVATFQLKTSQFSFALLSSANPSYFGQLITFTAKLAGIPGATTPSGTATFFIDGIAQSPAALVNGQAFIISPLLMTGNHTISALYSGDLYYSPAITSFFQAVTAAPFVCPPSHLHGVQKIKKKKKDNEIYNVLTWQKPNGSCCCVNPAYYYIYRDCQLTDFVACVRGDVHQYIDHHLVKGVAYTYYVVSVDVLGVKSKAATVKVKPKSRSLLK